MSGQVSLVEGAEDLVRTIAARVPSRWPRRRHGAGHRHRDGRHGSRAAGSAPRCPARRSSRASPARTCIWRPSDDWASTAGAASRSRTPAMASAPQPRPASRCSPSPTPRTRWPRTRSAAADSIHVSLDGVGRRMLTLLDAGHDDRRDHDDAHLQRRTRLQGRVPRRPHGRLRPIPAPGAGHVGGDVVDAPVTGTGLGHHRRWVRTLPSVRRPRRAPGCAMARWWARCSPARPRRRRIGPSRRSTAGQGVLLSLRQLQRRRDAFRLGR